MDDFFSPLVDINLYENDNVGDQAHDFVNFFARKGIAYEHLSYYGQRAQDDVRMPLRTWFEGDGINTAKLNRATNQYPFVIAKFCIITEEGSSAEVLGLYETVAELSADININLNVFA